MADEPSRSISQKKRIVSDVDHEYIRTIARVEIRNGCRDAAEIGRRIAAHLSATHRNAHLKAHERDHAYACLVGLAGMGARSDAVTVLQEGSIKVTRRGQVVQIRGAYAVSESLALNGNGAGPSDQPLLPADAPEPTAPTKRARPSHLYWTWDMVSWAIFDDIVADFKRRRSELAAIEQTLEAIGKLRTIYPDLTVGDAMRQAGLDLDTGAVDLDAVFKQHGIKHDDAI